MTAIAIPRRVPPAAALADTLVMARRHLIRLARTPQLAVSALVVPVMFLVMFRYIFGGAIPVPGMSYVDYLIPALFAQNAIFDGFSTAPLSPSTPKTAWWTASAPCRWPGPPCSPAAP